MAIRPERPAAPFRCRPRRCRWLVCRDVTCPLSRRDLPAGRDYGHPLLDQVTHSRLIIDPGCGYLTVVDLDGGRVRSVLTPHLAGADYPSGLAAFGDRLVMDSGDAAYVGPADLSRPAASIGPDTYFVPSGQPDRVWLVSLTGLFDSVVRLVDLTGRVVVPPRHLPPGALAVRGVGGRLLVAETTRGSARDSLWDPVTGQRSRPFGPAAVLDVHGQVVAWRQEGPCTTPPCPLHLLDTDTGRDRLVGLPPGFSDLGFTRCLLTRWQAPGPVRAGRQRPDERTPRPARGGHRDRHYCPRL